VIVQKFVLRRQSHPNSCGCVWPMIHPRAIATRHLEERCRQVPVRCRDGHRRSHDGEERCWAFSRPAAVLISMRGGRTAARPVGIRWTASGHDHLSHYGPHAMAPWPRWACNRASGHSELSPCCRCAISPMTVRWWVRFF